MQDQLSKSLLSHIREFAFYFDFHRKLVEGFKHLILHKLCMGDLQSMNHREIRLEAERSVNVLKCCRRDMVVAQIRVLMKMLRSGLDSRNTYCT